MVANVWLACVISSCGGLWFCNILHLCGEWTLVFSLSTIAFVAFAKFLRQVSDAIGLICFWGDLNVDIVTV